MNSSWKCMIELKTHEAMKYFWRLGYYTGKKADCKTRAWYPFLMNSFRMCMIELKTFQAIKYFRRIAYANADSFFDAIIKVYGVSGYEN